MRQENCSDYLASTNFTPVVKSDRLLETNDTLNNWRQDLGCAAHDHAGIGATHYVIENRKPE